jgi:hypothetical protein
MPYYAETGCSHPLIQITLIGFLLSKAYFHLEEEILNKFQLPLRNLFMV